MTNATVESNGAAAEHAADQTANGTEQKPTRALPSSRVTFDKQMSLLRAFAAASGVAKTAVNNADVASLIEMAPTTVSSCNPFFHEVGLLVKGAGGSVPAEAVFDFHRAHKWDAATAPFKLRTLIEESWFAERLVPKLGFRAMTVDEAIAELADEANATPRYKAQLEVVIDYLVASGLVERRDGRLSAKADRTQGSGEKVDPPERNDKPETAAEPPKAPPRSEQDDQAPPRSEQEPHGMRFTFDVKVSMQEMAGWSPDRITAFFNGVAQVLAAKGEAKR